MMTRRTTWRTVYRQMSYRELQDMQAAFRADRDNAIGPDGTPKIHTMKFCEQRLAFIAAELRRREAADEPIGRLTDFVTRGRAAQQAVDRLTHARQDVYRGTALTCQPHGRDRLQGHVWTSANVDAPCKCDQAVTWRQLMAARPQRPPTRHAATAGRRKGGTK